MSDLATKIAEGTSLLSDGQRFLFGQLGIGEEQLRLIGKLAWLKTDEKVSQLYYGHDFNFHVMFKTLISPDEIGSLLGKYDINGKYYFPQESGLRRAIIEPFDPQVSSLRIHFHDVKPD